METTIYSRCSAVLIERVRSVKTRNATVSATCRLRNGRVEACAFPPLVNTLEPRNVLEVFTRFLASEGKITLQLRNATTLLLSASSNPRFLVALAGGLAADQQPPAPKRRKIDDQVNNQVANNVERSSSLEKPLLPLAFLAVLAQVWRLDLTQVCSELRSAQWQIRSRISVRGACGSQVPLSCLRLCHRVTFLDLRRVIDSRLSRLVENIARTPSVVRNLQCVLLPGSVSENAVSYLLSRCSKLRHLEWPAETAGATLRAALRGHIWDSLHIPWPGGDCLRATRQSLQIRNCPVVALAAVQVAEELVEFGIVGGDGGASDASGAAASRTAALLAKLTRLRRLRLARWPVTAELLNSVSSDYLEVVELSEAAVDDAELCMQALQSLISRSWRTLRQVRVSGNSWLSTELLSWIISRPFLQLVDARHCPAGGAATLRGSATVVIDEFFDPMVAACPITRSPPALRPYFPLPSKAAALEL